MKSFIQKTLNKTNKENINKIINSVAISNSSIHPDFIENGNLEAIGRIQNRTCVDIDENRKINFVKKDKFTYDKIIIKPNNEIVINGHIYQQGSQKNNVNLSQNDMLKIYNYISHNIPKNLLSENLKFSDIKLINQEEIYDGLSAILDYNNLLGQEIETYSNQIKINGNTRLSNVDTNGLINIKLNGKNVDDLNSVSKLLFENNYVNSKYDNNIYIIS